MFHRVSRPAGDSERPSITLLSGEFIIKVAQVSFVRAVYAFVGNFYKFFELILRCSTVTVYKKEIFFLFGDFYFGMYCTALYS